MKECVICGNAFKAKTSEVACTVECRKEQAKRRHKEWVANNKERNSATKKRWKDKTRNLRNKYDDMNKQNKECVTCGKKYVGHFQSKTCSDKCRKAHISKGWKRRNPKSEIHKDCEYCGKSFEVYRAKRAKFCSVKCQRAERNARLPKKLNGFKYVVKGCEGCNEIFNSYMGRARFCSTKCATRTYNKKKLHDPMRRISARLSSGIRDVVKGRYENSNVWNFLDFTVEEFRQSFESLFTDGMSWDNMGVWHIDHIRPIASFNYTTTECEDFKKCWALNNLQPLWALDNQKKGDKWDGVVNA